MMRAIKRALIFLLGGVYASSWWFWFTSPRPITNVFVLNFIAVPLGLVLFFGTFGIVAAIIVTLVKHWKEE